MAGETFQLKRASLASAQQLGFYGLTHFFTESLVQWGPLVAGETFLPTAVKLRSCKWGRWGLLGHCY